MTRGAIRPTTHAEAVERARSIAGGVLLPVPPGAHVGAVPRPLMYRLALANGGKDPNAPHPGEKSWNDRYTADCAGAVAWMIGIDRLRKELPGGWFSSNSIGLSAKRGDGWFEEVGRPEPGDIVAYAGTYLAGVRVKVGHIALVTTAPVSGDPFDVQMVDCSSSQSKKLGHAVTERACRPVFAQRGRFFKYLRAAP